MRIAILFLATLLLAEAFLPPPSVSLMMLYLPIRTAIFAYKTFRFTMRMRAFLRTVRLARRMLGLMLKRQDRFMGLGSVMGLVKDSCLQRLICEINAGQHRRQRRLITAHRKSRNFTDSEERIAITFKLSGHNDSCEKKFKSCPYSSKDMLQALKKFGTVWKDVKLPNRISTRLSQKQADHPKQRR